MNTLKPGRGGSNLNQLDTVENTKHFHTALLLERQLTLGSKIGRLPCPCTVPTQMALKNTVMRAANDICCTAWIPFWHITDSPSPTERRTSALEPRFNGSKCPTWISPSPSTPRQPTLKVVYYQTKNSKIRYRRFIGVWKHLGCECRNFACRRFEHVVPVGSPNPSNSLSGRVLPIY